MTQIAVVAIRNATGGRPTAMKLDGVIVAINDLPAQDTHRWVVSKKAKVAGAVMVGLLTREEALKRYRALSGAELDSWVKLIRGGDINALKTTHSQNNKPEHFDQTLPTPVEDFYVAQFGNLLLYNNREITDGQKTIKLTRLQCKILSYLMLNPGLVVSKEALLRLLYPHGNQAEQKIIDVSVSKIRKEIVKAFGVETIETVWGRGYMIPVHETKEG